MNLRTCLAAISCGATMLGCNAVLGVHQLEASAAGERAEASPAGMAAGAGNKAEAPKKHDEAGAVAGDGGDEAAGRGGFIAHSPTAGHHAGGAGASAPSRAGSVAEPTAGTRAMATAGTQGMATAGTSAMPAAPGDVHGKVIDTLGRPVTNLQVRIGSDETTTDAGGEFTLASIPASYDVALVFTRQDTRPETYRNAWVFEGLQRRQPILQIYPGASNQALRLNIQATGLMPTLPMGQVIYAAFGGKEGGGQAATYQNAVEIGGYWQGESVMPGNVHALLFSADNARDDLPLEYLAAASRSVTVKGGANDDIVSLDLTGAKPEPAAISGTVKHVRPDGYRETWINMRWADGVSLGLPGSDSDAFSLLAPKLPDASISVVALEGSVLNPPYAVAFADNLAPGTSGVALTIPLVAELRAPSAMKTGVGADTSFEWAGGDTKINVFRVQSKEHSDEVMVVTSQKTAHLPSIYLLAANTKFTWQVETHGTGDKTVDDIAEKGDWLSAFWYDRLRGPKRGDGTYTTTELREFTTAP